MNPPAPQTNALFSAIFLFLCSDEKIYIRGKFLSQSASDMIPLMFAKPIFPIFVLDKESFDFLYGELYREWSFVLTDKFFVNEKAEKCVYNVGRQFFIFCIL
jgi:hypothetical protein